MLPTVRRRRHRGGGPPPSPRGERGSRSGDGVPRAGRGLTLLAKGVAEHLDVALALVAALALTITWSTIGLTHRLDASIQPLFAVVSVAPLLLVRHRPVLAWGVSFAGSVLWSPVPRVGEWPMPWPVMHFLVLLALVLVVAMVARLVHVAAAVVTTALFLLLVMEDELKPWALGVVIIAAFGLLLRWLVLSRRQLARQEEEAEVEKARRSVLEERGRIARELHDVVAHHMSMIVVQSQSAPYRVTDVSPAAREEFLAIEGSARQALGEVRGLLGVLREERAPTRTAPQPGLADVTPLLEQARAAGVEVEEHLALDAAACPPGTGLVIYRILGEALANAARHAPGASVEVELVQRGEQADLRVRNGPGATSDPTEEGGGHGIPGMRARAEAVGGVLEVGPEADGGFLVHAVFPLTDRPDAN